MKKKQLVIAMAFVAITCFAISSCNNQSNQDSSTGNEYVSVNEPQQSYNIGAGTYTFKGTDGTNYKVVLKPRKGEYQSGQAVLYVNGKETDFGSWRDMAIIGQGLCVYFADTFLKIPGKSSYINDFNLKDGYAYADCVSAESENPNKRVKYTKTK